MADRQHISSRSGMQRRRRLPSSNPSKMYDNPQRAYGVFRLE
jgi:hypothetical protein